MNQPLSLLFLGLSLSSSWGNGHATTYRALLKGLAALGHRIHFLERDVPWYADNRDLSRPEFCRLDFYKTLDELCERFSAEIAAADAVVIGSYVPDGIALIDMIAGRAGGALVFYDIDTPVTCTRLGRDDAEYIAARQVPLFDLYCSFSGGPILRVLENRFNARRAEPLYCAVDEQHYYSEPAAAPRWDLGYIGTYSVDRQPTLEKLLLAPARLLPQKRFVVAGPQYPADIRWPDNVDRIEHLPPAEHRDFYNGLRFTLNVTRADMISAGWSPSVRLFEAAACGTPIISDAWDGLSSILPHRDAILIAQSTQDVIDALVNIDEGERKRIAEAAQERVLRRHTGLARARELETYLQSLPIGVGKRRASAAGGRSEYHAALMPN
jgi:spore maturation protein CgeB